MSPRSKLITTLVLLVFLGGLGVADYYLSGNEFAATVSDLPPAVSDNSSSSTAAVAAGTGSGTTIATTSTTVGVKKQNGPEIQTTIENAGFTTTKSDDLSFIAQVAGSGSQIHALAILKDGDRAGSVTWVESPEVKNQFIALKEALLTAFSPQVKDLKDQTLQGNDLPIRNELSFMDPTLSAERLFFVRVRERLYEFHIAAGNEDAMNTLIETLTTK